MGLINKAKDMWAGVPADRRSSLAIAFIVLWLLILPQLIIPSLTFVQWQIFYFGSALILIGAYTAVVKALEWFSSNWDIISETAMEMKRRRSGDEAKEAYDPRAPLQLSQTGREFCSRPPMEQAIHPIPEPEAQEYRDLSRQATEGFFAHGRPSTGVAAITAKELESKFPGALPKTYNPKAHVLNTGVSTHARVTEDDMLRHGLFLHDPVYMEILRVSRPGAHRVLGQRTGFDPADLPQLGSKWLHHSQRAYTVLGFANLRTVAPETTEHRREKFPVMVVYFDENNVIYSQRVATFLQDFAPIEEVNWPNLHRPSNPAQPGPYGDPNVHDRNQRDGRTPQEEKEEARRQLQTAEGVDPGIQVGEDQKEEEAPRYG